MNDQTREQEEPRLSDVNRFRRHPRVRIAAPFACALSSLKPRHWLRKPTVNLGVVYDLSLRGARVSTRAVMRPGDEVTITLRLPKQIRSADVSSATVRWTRDQFVGLAFTRLSAASYGRLKKYVAIATGAVHV
ncbi:conserved protein of unknown function [Nitrospira japonica]|uniref:PilZ domain-containing protein n=1 Tax=Nitrospira japonica TaxID=1325564 RepID=A0A1W1I7K0_9BACT|nr:PilZ domain-containing protein [Nitrospira japonica]SLM48783.1 conserved protein of unknown function [Nitrospira japonica]